MYRKLLLIFLVFASQASASFDPITDDMIEKGLSAFSTENSDYIAPLRQGLGLDSMQSASRSILDKRFVQSKSGQGFPIMVLNVIRGMKGIILFFLWDKEITPRENFQGIDQFMFNTGEFSHYKGNKRLGSLSYSFHRADPGKRMCYKPDVGYYPAPPNTIPFIYCNLDYYAVAYDYWNRGVGDAFVQELARFAFQGTSVDFITALVADDNVSSRAVLTKNGFKLVKSIVDKNAPGYDRENCVGRSNVYISFDGEESFVQAGLSIGTRVDFYLPRNGRKGVYLIKSSL